MGCKMIVSNGSFKLIFKYFCITKLKKNIYIYMTVKIILEVKHGYLGKGLYW